MPRASRASAKRLQELQAKAARERFGELVQVSESQYKQEINEAGKGVWVVVCLFQPGIPACALLLQRLSALARKFRATKFVKIVATDAIRNYPDRNCPTLLIYYEGELKRQLVGLTGLAGMNTTEAGACPGGRGVECRAARPRSQHVRPRRGGWCVFLCADVEWFLKKVGAVDSDMEEPPRPQIPLRDAVALANAVFDDDD